jgi:outer membrane protein assembly factor BamB
MVVLLVLTVAGAVRADDWPQCGPMRDGIWRETGILTKFPRLARMFVGGPRSASATPAPPSPPDASSSPTSSRTGRPRPGGRFQRGKLNGNARPLLDEATGKVLWTHSCPCVYTIAVSGSPRCTPLWTATASTARQPWEPLLPRRCHGQAALVRDFVTDYDGNPSTWGFSGHPLLDGDKLICLAGGRRGAVVVAFDKTSGKEVWKALSAQEPGYAPPTIYTFGGKRQLIVWHPESVNGLDPETGKSYWSQRFPLQAGMSIATPRQDGDRLFVTAFYNGPMMLEVSGGESPSAKLVWKGKSNSELPGRTDGLHSVMATPFLKDGHVYGVCSHGELRASTRQRAAVWETFAATTGKGTLGQCLSSPRRRATMNASSSPTTRGT